MPEDYEIGSLTIIVRKQVKESYELDKYDVYVLDDEGNRIKKAEGCMGISSMRYWWRVAYEWAIRYNTLLDALDETENKMIRYRGKDECVVQYRYECEKIAQLRKWLYEIK